MMVETILESSQDFGMAGGALPQWKRELLQRRAARTVRPPPPAPPLPPPPPPPADDEELRYGPGIVKRLKSRYLSLALRDAPRRRPSVLRRAASLEHLDERPPPAPRPAARAPRPAAPPSHAPAHRRDAVKRARSVDALSRLEPRDPPEVIPTAPPPPRTPPPPPPPLPRPTPTSRPPRRPVPLLRDAERPPPDLVRSTLRKFEPAPTRRAAPAARVSAALRGLERGVTSPTPPPTGAPDVTSATEARSPSPMGAAPPPPLTPPSPIDEPSSSCVPVAGSRAVSRAALEGIARAGCSTRYAFEAPRRGSHLPPLAAANPVMLGRARRVGVIRPMPAPTLERAVCVPAPTPAPTPAADFIKEKAVVVEEPSRPPTPGARDTPTPPAALVEPIPRPAPDAPPPARRPSPDPVPAKIDRADSKPNEIERSEKNEKYVKTEKPEKITPKTEKRECGVVMMNGHGGGGGGAWGSLRPRAQTNTSVVFNFSHRKDVPDYIENDGLVLRAARRDAFKAGESGVVILRREGGGGDNDSDDDDGDCNTDGTCPPSPCDVRFVNDNVLINGRSSMPTRRDRDRQAKLKLQFDDSLTRTFEYPSETSLCVDSDDDVTTSTPTQTSTPAASTLAANTHIASAALSRYTPSKTCADAFQLGVTRRADTHAENTANGVTSPAAAAACDAEGGAAEGGAAAAGGDARPCGADAARSWSDARARTTDLLF